MTSIYKKTKEFLKRNSKRFTEWLQIFQLEPSTRKGIVITLFITVLLGLGFAGYKHLQTGWGYPVDVLLGMLIGLIAIGLGYALFRLSLLLLAKLSTKFAAFVLAVFITLLFLLWGNPETGFLLIAGIVLAAATLGGTLTIATSPKFKTIRMARKIGLGSGFGFSLLAFIALFWWLAQTGSVEELVKIESTSADSVAQLKAPNPSLRGSYQIESLTYGSGEDRRPEFGENASLKTASVNGKALTGELEGELKFLRKDYWKFDCTELPLNGRVWYPQGEGPFPLVLVVHGNHSMREYSDPGYAYLGELLASRGYILVSVDENFLNGDWAANYKKENDARGWLMLEHIKTWKQWNEDPENPFHGKVDMERISLIGHSRGGEAVSVAAAFNKLQHYPDDARVTFDYGFNIRSVIAIAPIDGQYKPSNQSTPLENINYLLLQGSHDADVSFFSGDRQYKRIKFTDGKPCFKTSIYIYRANHGQFNTVWGNRDYGFPGGYLLNTKALISGKEQRQIAKVYISSFLDATLKGKQDYLPLFRDYRKGLKWLPETHYIGRFENSYTRYICDFEEDIKPSTTTLKDGMLEGKALADWKEQDIGFRSGNSLRQNKAVLLGWEYQMPDSSAVTKDSLSPAEKVNPHQTKTEDSIKIFVAASYSITLPHNMNTKWKLDKNASLTFAIAQVDKSPSKPLDLEKKKDDKEKQEDQNAKEDTNLEDEKQEDEKDKETNKCIKPLNFTIVLEDQQAETIKMSMQDVGLLMPPLKAKFTRFQPIEDHYGKSSEPILQTFNIPLSRLKSLNDKFVPEKLKSIQFLFDKSPKGVILLDEVGFRSRD